VEWAIGPFLYCPSGLFACGIVVDNNTKSRIRATFCGLYSMLDIGEEAKNPILFYNNFVAF
jgi:hypothetical protein